MAQKPYVIEGQLREQRQRLYQAASVLSEQFPAAREVVFELRFSDPDRKVSPSPHKRIFTADMQAFFEFQCPLKECGGGGFSLTREISNTLSGRRTEVAGKLQCQGKRKRENSGTSCCGLELHYQVTLLKKDRAAA